MATLSFKLPDGSRHSGELTRWEDGDAIINVAEGSGAFYRIPKYALLDQSWQWRATVTRPVALDTALSAVDGVCDVANGRVASHLPADGEVRIVRGNLSAPARELAEEQIMAALLAQDITVSGLDVKRHTTIRADLHITRPLDDKGFMTLGYKAHTSRPSDEELMTFIEESSAHERTAVDATHIRPGCVKVATESHLNHRAYPGPYGEELSELPVTADGCGEDPHINDPQGEDEPPVQYGKEKPAHSAGYAGDLNNHDPGREEQPGTDFITKADADGETIAGPGIDIEAVDDTAKKYYKKYYKDYGDKLVSDFKKFAPPAKRVKAHFARTANRAPTLRERIICTAALTQFDKEAQFWSNRKTDKAYEELTSPQPVDPGETYRRPTEEIQKDYADAQSDKELDEFVAQGLVGTENEDFLTDEQIREQRGLVPGEADEKEDDAFPVSANDAAEVLTSLARRNEDLKFLLDAAIIKMVTSYGKGLLQEKAGDVAYQNMLPAALSYVQTRQPGMWSKIKRHLTQGNTRQQLFDKQLKTQTQTQEPAQTAEQEQEQEQEQSSAETEEQTETPELGKGEMLVTVYAGATGSTWDVTEGKREVAQIKFIRDTPAIATRGATMGEREQPSIRLYQGEAADTQIRLDTYQALRKDNGKAGLAAQATNDTTPFEFINDKAEQEQPDNVIELHPEVSDAPEEDSTPDNVIPLQQSEQQENVGRGVPKDFGVDVDESEFDKGEASAESKQYAESAHTLLNQLDEAGATQKQIDQQKAQITGNDPQSEGMRDALEAYVPGQGAPQEFKDRLERSFYAKKLAMYKEAMMGKQKRVAKSYAESWKAFHLDGLERRGMDIVATVQWDSDNEDRSDNAMKHAVRHYIIGMSSQKEHRSGIGDLGNIGRVRFMDFDPEAGMALVAFRSTDTAIAPQSITITSKDLQ